MYLVTGILFWYLGRQMETWNKLTPKAKPWLPWLVAFAGALTFSLSAPADWISTGLSWAAEMVSTFIAMFGASVPPNYILTCFGIFMVGMLIKGLSDGQLDKRDIGYTAILPIITLAMGGVIGDLFASARNLGSDLTQSLITTLGG